MEGQTGLGPGPDWTAPWLRDYCATGQALQQSVGGGLTVAEALNRQLSDLPAACRPVLRGQVLRFVPQAALPAGEGYEAFIARTAAVPTRAQWHDALNGLVWLRWPALKARLNALHLEGLASPEDLDDAGVPPRAGARPRGALRDALTLFDENGVWLEAPHALCEALQARDWPRLFLTLRPLWAEARLHVIGHALMEKLMQPRKPICAHVLLRDPLTLQAADWAGKPFAPLPVLGIPGWWAPNETATFYADPDVFRPRAPSASPQCG